MTRCSIGQDSHRFASDPDRKCVLGGVVIPDAPGFEANSDGDVLLHALTNAVSGITGRNILGPPADRICRAGITDSRVYLAEALADLRDKIVHVSFTLEGSRPRLWEHIPAIKAAVAGLLNIDPSRVGLTATTGEGLTAFGRGEGISVFCILTVGE
ncbi:MAG: 2-C-methyl-D-erythritol 2,4-cyclodiphosphate synthase [Lachnospiraceae bacterium]|nr:2-C-methyl-D-erythritol 2,4-cyclodiphosphate synthase [Lachnospiraceae bacterium]